jgi:hypothetical protein
MRQPRTRKLIEQDYYSQPESARQNGFAAVMNKMALEMLENIVTGPASKLKLLAAKSAAAAAARKSSTYQETAAAKAASVPRAPVRNSNKPRTRRLAARPKPEELDDEDKESIASVSAPPVSQTIPEQNYASSSSVSPKTAPDSLSSKIEVVRTPSLPTKTEEKEGDISEADFKQISEHDTCPSPVNMSSSAIAHIQKLSMVAKTTKKVSDQMKEVDANVKQDALKREEFRNAKLKALETKMDSISAL